MNKVGLGGSDFPIESYIFKLYFFTKNTVRALLLYLLDPKFFVKVSINNGRLKNSFLHSCGGATELTVPPGDS